MGERRVTVGELLAFDRDLPCPACGIRLEIIGVCREAHRDLAPSGDPHPPAGHLHVACPGCGWSAYMQPASARAARAAQAGDADVDRPLGRAAGDHGTAE